MLPRDKKLIQEQIDKISLGNFDKDNVQILLINIRDHITNNQSRLKELSHFVAHSIRDKGISYAHISKHAKQTKKVFKYGGKLTVDPIFNKDKIYSELELFLVKHKITYNKILLTQSYEKFFIALFNFLHDIEIKLDTDLVESVIFDGDYDSLTYIIKFKDDINGAIRLPRGVPIGFPVFNE
jgi:hypothetical protein